MGYMRHHAIIVTGAIPEKLHAAHAAAQSIFPVVTAIVDSETNGYGSFMVPPDGSKEGWEESDEGNTRRELFLDALSDLRYPDGYPFEWVEIQYGDDDRETVVTHHSDEAWP